MKQLSQNLTNEAMRQVKSLPPSMTNDIMSGVRGFWIAASSMYKNVMSDSPAHTRVRAQLKNYVRGTLPLILTMYGLLIALCIAMFPVFLGMLLITPGVAWSLFATIPLWSLNIYKRLHPKDSGNLFIEELKTVNPSLAKQMSDRIAAPFNELPSSRRKPFFLVRLYQALRNSLKRSSHFTSWSFMLFLISFIPIVGSIVTVIGQTYLVSESLGAQLMEVYTKDYQRWDHSKREEWRKDHRWELFGFSLPFTLLLSVPFVGPFLLAFAQAGAADLFQQVIIKRDQEKQAREYVQQSNP